MGSFGRKVTVMNRIGCTAAEEATQEKKEGEKRSSKNVLMPKNWRLQNVVLEKTLESPLHSKEIKPVNPKGNQPWIFIGRIDAKAEAPALWPSDAKSRFTGKDPDAGKDWGQEEKGMTRGWDGWMASSTQWTWVWGDGDGQGSLACCSPWGHKKLDATEQLNNKASMWLQLCGLWSCLRTQNKYVLKKITNC